MSATPEEVGILATLAKWLWAPFAALGTWILSRLDKRFDAMEKAIAGKADKSEVENNRRDIKELFGKIDSIKDDIGDKHSELLRAIYESKK